MKLNRIITLCAVAAALALSVGSVFAQDNGNGNGNDNGGGQRRNRQGGGPGGGNFDPAQMQQRMHGQLSATNLAFTNDTDWSAVQPLVQKVMDAQRDVRGARHARRRSPAAIAVAKTAVRGSWRRTRRYLRPAQPGTGSIAEGIDDNAPPAQVKDLLAKYKASQQAKQAKLEAAQDALKSVLTSKQEAQAYLLGLVR